MDTFSYPSRTNSSLAASRISCRRNFFCRALRSFTPIALLYLTNLTSLTIRAVSSLVNGVLCLPRSKRRLFLYRDRLQFEVRPAQQRPRAHKLARWKILGREVAPVNRIECIEERQVRARNLYIHQVVHGHAGLRQYGLLPVQQILNLILDFLRRLSSFRIQSEPPRQVQRIPRKDSVAERKLRAQLPQPDHLPRCLRGSFRKRSVHCKNSRHRQSHHQNSCATIHVSLHSNALPATPRECSTQSALRQAARSVLLRLCKLRVR